MRDRLHKSATEVDEDLQAIEPDELVRKEWTQVMEPPPTLILPILPYQKEGLGWMYNQVGPICDWLGREAWSYTVLNMSGGRM